MKSAVRRILLLSALVSPNALYALGLGEIHLNSALNQPFDADIEIVSATDDDLSALRASLAPSDTFARYGLDKPGYMADFTFKVIRSSGGKDYLKVTSPRPVTEPFVTMLVEADWPRGKLLREYTVLLDPPVYAPGPQAADAPVATARVQPVARPAAPAPAPAPAAQIAPAAPAGPVEAPRAAIAPGSTYRVRPNDTLWKIAEESHPGSRSDVNRAMVAIYQSNPQAFDGNINLLRAGSTLSIPDASAVSSISATAAAAEVSRQYQSWREGGSAATGDSGGGRLRLVTPEQGTAAASTATQAPATPTAPASSALQGRVKQLESELAEARRLLEVKNAELATLQAQTAAQAATKAPATGAPAPAPTATTPPAPAAGATGPAPTGEAAGTPAEPPAAQAQEPKKEQKKKEPKKPRKAKPAAATAEGPSLVERLAGYWWVLLGLIAAGVAFVLYRRGRGDTNEVDLQEALARTRTDLRARVPSPRDTNIVVEERRPVETATPAGRPAAPVRKPATTTLDDTISGEEPVSVEAGDPLAEADFHMAYGLYDQAADLVQLAIKRAPQRRDLKVKLLEIYFVWGNRDRFVELARELGASRVDGPAGEWDKILIMGKQIAPDDTLFATARSSPASLDMELHGSQGPLDMDLGADTSTVADVDLANVKSTSDTGLDFEFTEPSTGDTASIAPTVELRRFDDAVTDDPTQEVSIDELGLEVGDLKSLDDTLGGEDMLRPSRRAALEDTVESPRPGVEDTVETERVPRTIEDTIETPRAGRGAIEDTVETPRVGRGGLDATVEAPRISRDGDDDDPLNATGILKDQTGILQGIEITAEVPEIDLTETTNEVQAIGTVRIERPSATTSVDFDLGGDEPLTMSEVGTKLDLARAYVDMGDPEGARSILEEVLKEGSTDQKQEAERLIAGLP
ncbi:MAG: FimV/HubP family polar landmark protein [Steroidobacteraceae bacterium]